jgi:hypothetical protein
MKLCRSNVEVLLGAFCVAGRTFLLRSISNRKGDQPMEPALTALWHGKIRPSEQFLLHDPEHKKMTEAWLKLRKELDSLITDEKLRQVLHDLEITEMNLAESAEIAAFRAGYALGAAMAEEVAKERSSIGFT